MKVAELKLCTSHHEALRAELDRRGLLEQCAVGEQQFLERMRSGNPDPFMDAQLRLMQVAMNVAGRAAVIQNVCPVCALQRADYCALAVEQVVTRSWTPPTDSVNKFN